MSERERNYAIAIYIIGWLCCASFFQARQTACNLHTPFIGAFFAVSGWPVFVPLLAIVLPFSDDRCAMAPADRGGER